MSHMTHPKTVLSSTEHRITIIMERNTSIEHRTVYFVQQNYNVCLEVHVCVCGLYMCVNYCTPVMSAYLTP